MRGTRECAGLDLSVWQYLLALALIIGGGLTIATADVTAQNATYYNSTNITGNVTADGWLPAENATLDSMLDLMARTGPEFIGIGGADPSGTGFVGVLLTGLIMVGVALGTVMGAGLGAVGGTLAALLVGFGVTTAGLAPAWVQPLLLFGIAAVVGLAAIRAYEGP